MLISKAKGADMSELKNKISQIQVDFHQALENAKTLRDLDQIKTAHKIDADMIEMHTGAFCDATSEHKKNTEFTRIVDAAKIGSKLKLGVNAGHGICYNSIKAFKGLDEISEFSIGHSIISRAVMTGMDQAVKDMVQLIKEL